VQEFLEPRPIAIAAAVAALLTLIAALLLSLALAAIVLILSFFATWAFLALRSYEQRRPTRDMDEVSKERGSDPAPFSG
jgi:Flp pilus assembly protein TadB